MIEDSGTYEGQRIAGLVLAGSTARDAQFENCVFERCTFTEATWHRCRFVDCRFVSCDLSLLKVPNSRIQGTRFERCKLAGIDWTVAGDSRLSKLTMTLAFHESVLSYASFAGLYLPDLVLTHCTAHETDFAEARLSGADLRDTDFAGAVFLHTNLEDADLRGASNYAIDPRANKLRGAKFALPEAVSLLRGFEIIVE